MDTQFSVFTATRVCDAVSHWWGAWSTTYLHFRAFSRSVPELDDIVRNIIALQFHSKQVGSKGHNGLSTEEANKEEQHKEARKMRHLVVRPFGWKWWSWRVKWWLQWRQQWWTYPWRVYRCTFHTSRQYILLTCMHRRHPNDKLQLLMHPWQ